MIIIVSYIPQNPVLIVKGPYIIPHNTNPEPPSTKPKPGATPCPCSKSIIGFRV